MEQFSDNDSSVDCSNDINEVDSDDDIPTLPAIPGCGEMDPSGVVFRSAGNSCLRRPDSGNSNSGTKRVVVVEDSESSRRRSETTAGSSVANLETSTGSEEEAVFRRPRSASAPNIGAANRVELDAFITELRRIGDEFHRGISKDSPKKQLRRRNSLPAWWMATFTEAYFRGTRL